MLPMCKYSTIEEDPFYQIINLISKETCLKPFFLARDPEDQMILKFKKYLPGCKSFDSSCDDFLQVQKAIGEFPFLLSGRYHHLIFSLNANTNICPLSSSSHKIEGLVELTSMDKKSFCYDPTYLSPSIESIVSHCVSIADSEYKFTPPSVMKKELIDSYSSIFA